MRSGSDPVSNANLCNPTRAAAAVAAVCVARVESVLCLCVRAREEKEERGRKRGSRNCGAAEKVSFAADIELQPSRPHSVVIIPEQVFIENWDFLTIKHDFLVPMDSH